MNIRSILKPEGSVGASLATAGIVYSIYNLSIGSVSQAHASDANHPALEASRKKAGYTAFILVAALGLITRDGNVTTVGFGSIVAMEISYRHGIMASPQTGKVQAPIDRSYRNADNVIPLGIESAPDAVGY